MQYVIDADVLCKFFASLLFVRHGLIGRRKPLVLAIDSFFISILLVPSIVAFGVVIIRGGYRSVADYFSEAWKDFTVEE